MALVLSDIKRLQTLSNQFAISSDFISYNPPANDSQLIDIYKNSRLFLLGSSSECQPLVLIDAISFGLPFVSRSSGYINSIDGGLKVSSEMSMASAISNIYHNTPYLENLSTQGRECFNKFHSQSAFESHWNEIINTHI